MRIALYGVVTQQGVIIPYHYLLRHNPQECSSQLLCGGSLKSCILHLAVNMCPPNLPFLFQLRAVGLQLQSLKMSCSGTEQGNFVEIGGIVVISTSF